MGPGRDKQQGEEEGVGHIHHKLHERRPHHQPETVLESSAWLGLGLGLGLGMGFGFGDRAEVRVGVRGILCR